MKHIQLTPGSTSIILSLMDGKPMEAHFLGPNTEQMPSMLGTAIMNIFDHMGLEPWEAATWMEEFALQIREGMLESNVEGKA